VPTGAYVVQEEAKAAPDGCVVSAKLTTAKGETLVAAVEHGAAADVLQIQSRLNQKIVDALHIESSSTGKKTGLSDAASVKDYIQAGDKYRQTDPELAAALYRKALSVDAANKDAVNRLAQSLLDANRPQDVVDLIREPTDISQYYLLASAYLKLGDNAKVLDELNRGLRLGSTDRDSYQKASSILEQIGEYKAAADALELGAAHAQPNNGLAAMANDTLRRGAKTLIFAGRSKEALPLALASLKKDPNSEWGQRLAGIAYIDLKDPGKGEEYLQAAMHIKPTAYSEVELGQLRITQKRYAEARAYAEQAIETDPDWSSGFDTLQNTVQNAQDAAEVRAWLDKYVTMVPPNKLALTYWSYIQTRYLPNDAAAIHRQYSAFKEATKNVPYADWPVAWTDLVELSMLDNHVEEAAHLADALLAANLTRHVQVNMGYYSWLTYLLLRNCKNFETSLDASLEILHSSDVPETNTWDFTSTRKFVADREAQRKLNSSGMALVTGGLKLLEGSITPANVQQFDDLASQSRKEACPAK
jgi:tetratricopeptide (TPR) repeat protein